MYIKKINYWYAMRYFIVLLGLLLYPHCELQAKNLPFDGVYGAKIIDLDTKEVVFEKNANLPLLPASNQKLITLYSALNVLDLEEKVYTSVYHDGTITKGVLDGNIYFKFRGDPELDKKRLKSLITSIKDFGITSIKGNVYVDDFEFDQEFFGGGWPVDQTKFCYSAPIASIIYNRNCYHVSVNTNNNGDLSFLSEHKPYTYSIIDSSHQEEFKDKYCDLELKANADNTYLLSGCHQAKNFPLTLKLAVQNPRDNIKGVISSVLDDLEINFSGFEFQRTPAILTKISDTTSRTIKELLSDMSKESDNMYAEIIFKKISARATGYSGNWKNSSIITKDLLVDNLGLDPTTFNLHDGSGLSRKNIIAANVFTTLLANAYEDKNITKYFLDSLPAAGVDGTLKRRFKNSLLEKMVFAKTGTIDNASALSGYVFLDNGKKYAFSILINNFTVASSNAKRFEEELLEEVLSLNHSS